MSYEHAYLTALAVASVLAFVNRESRVLVGLMAVDSVATMVLQDHAWFSYMPVADAALFSLMVLVGLFLQEAKKWKVIACGLIGMGVLVHIAYFGLGDRRFDFSYFHMYAEQWLFLLAMTALAGGDDNVFQRVRGVLEHLRGRPDYATGAVWARVGCSPNAAEEAP